MAYFSSYAFHSIITSTTPSSLRFCSHRGRVLEFLVPGIQFRAMVVLEEKEAVVERRRRRRKGATLEEEAKEE